MIAAACLISLIGFGDPVQLRPISGADDGCQRLVAGDLCAGDGDPEPIVGHCRTGGWSDRGPVRDSQGSRPRGGGLLRRRCRNGDVGKRARAAPDRGGSRRSGSSLLLVLPRAGGHCPRNRAGTAILGVGAGDRRRISRPGCLFSDQSGLDIQLRLVRLPIGDVCRFIGPGASGVQPSRRPRNQEEYQYRTRA